jgi:hypothetical protein
MVTVIGFGFQNCGLLVHTDLLFFFSYRIWVLNGRTESCVSKVWLWVIYFFIYISVLGLLQILEWMCMAWFFFSFCFVMLVF